MAYAQARRAGDIQPASALLRLSDHFEQLMVIPGSQAVLVLGLLAAWLGGHPLLGTLQGARTNWLLVSLLLSLSMIPIIAVLFVPRRKLRRLALEDVVYYRRVASHVSTGSTLHETIVYLPARPWRRRFWHPEHSALGAPLWRATSRAAPAARSV